MVVKEKMWNSEREMRNLDWQNISTCLPQFWLGLQLDYALDTAEDELAARIDEEVRVYSAV